MRKSEKILSAIVVMALGLLFVILRGGFISMIMTVAGVGLIVIGVMDLIQRNVPSAVIKIVSGVLIIIAGWAVVAAVLYILAALLLISGILWLYAEIRRREKCSSVWAALLQFVRPALCIAVGLLLLFQQSEIIDIILICSGVLIMIEGGLLLIQALNSQD